MSEQVLVLCKDTNIKVTSILNEISKKEDVTEFITTVQLIQVTINNLLLRNKEKEFSFDLLKELQHSLKDYETLLSQLNSQQGGLIRYFTSNRLRRKIEIANSQLHNKLEKFRESIKDAEETNTKDTEPTTEITTSAPEEEAENPNIRLSLMIEDVEGKDLWAHLFGLETFMVKWDKFIAALKTILPDVKEDEAKVLQYILDNSNTGHINQHKFSEFLKGFGPIQDCLKNVKSILSAKWFYGFLTRPESELLLRDQPVGTFLIRFSSSQPGSFALAYSILNRGEKAIFHILINSSKPVGFQVPENQTSRTFQNLYEIAEYYSVFLQHPFQSDTPFESWFEGDNSSAEAVEVLSGHKQGTFLVRFSASAPGAYAVSFVTADGAISHSLIERVSAGYRIENTLVFKSLQEVIQHYSATLQTPIKHVTNELFVEATKVITQNWKRDREKQMEIVQKLVNSLFDTQAEMPPLPEYVTKKMDEKDPKIVNIISRIFEAS